MFWQLFGGLTIGRKQMSSPLGLSDLDHPFHCVQMNDEFKTHPSPSERYVEFNYKDDVEELPISCRLPVHIIQNDIGETTIKDEKNKKHRSRSRSKSVKAAFNSKLNVQLLEPVFRPLVPEKKLVHKDPHDSGMAYHRYLDETVDEDDQINVEYDMDEEDSIWLRKINKQRRKERLLDVSADTFELIMDRLEKECFFQSQFQGNNVHQAIDEDAVCCICNDGECQNANAILFCDMCNLAVHQECYGVPYIPEGQWLCRRCMHSPSRAVDCVLCPNQGGAFKQTDDNRWAHVICAIWIPEVCFANTVFLEPIDSIVSIPAARWKLTCSICQIKNSGACIQCHKSNCYVAFHVTCAQQAGLYMKVEAVKDKTSSGQVSNVRKTAYCNTHAPVSSKSGSKFPIYSSGDEESRSQESNKNLDLNGKNEPSIPRSFIPTVSIPTIPVERLSKLSELLSFPRRNQFLIRLYSYWKLKRQSRNGVPLLRRLQNNNFLKMNANNEKIRKRDKQQCFLKFKQIRRDFERVRLLLELVKKRERLKLKIAKEEKQLFVYKLTPFKCFLMNIVDRIIEKDVNRFFLEPVSIEYVPDYLTFITNPMDLGTMKTKVDHHEYTSFECFEKDLKLIVDNCCYYNEKETIWHKAALKLNTFIESILNENRPLVCMFNQKSGMHLSNID